MTEVSIDREGIRKQYMIGLTPILQICRIGEIRIDDYRYLAEVAARVVSGKNLPDVVSITDVIDARQRVANCQLPLPIPMVTQEVFAWA
jgi:hypothetical protein